MCKFTKSKIKQFKDRFMDFDLQKSEYPDHVVFDFVGWIYHQWDMGLINLQDYRKLIRVDILKV